MPSTLFSPNIAVDTFSFAVHFQLIGHAMVFLPLIMPMPGKQIRGLPNIEHTLLITLFLV